VGKVGRDAGPSIPRLLAVATYPFRRFRELRLSESLPSGSRNIGSPCESMPQGLRRLFCDLLDGPKIPSNLKAVMTMKRMSGVAKSIVSLKEI
jgi:hypothetical protein